MLKREETETDNKNIPFTYLMFSVFKAINKCSETDTFEFHDWLIYLNKLELIIPNYESLSTILV